MFLSLSLFHCNPVQGGWIEAEKYGMKLATVDLWGELVYPEGIQARER